MVCLKPEETFLKCSLLQRRIEANNAEIQLNSVNKVSYFIEVKEDGSSLSCVLRMIKKDGSTAWVDITAEKSQESVGNSFVCSYILIE